MPFRKAYRMAPSVTFSFRAISQLFFQIKVELSADGKNYMEVSKIKNILTDRRFGVEPVYHSLEFQEAGARFIKVTALSMKICPEWHRGAGQPSWIFCDEIIVE